jgi:hypothetical protein
MTTCPHNVGTTQYAEIFGGIVVTDDQTQMDVYLTSLDPATESAIECGQPSSEFTFLSTKNSAQFLESLQATIVNDHSALQAQGINIVLLSPVISTGLEDISVENVTSSEVGVLDGKYGTNNIQVTNVSRNQVPQPLTLGSG